MHFFLSDEHYEGNILKDDSFKHSREVLTFERKFLKQQGLGNKVLWVDPFTDKELYISKKKPLLGKVE